MIEKPSFTIGRTKDADLPILESTISRVHLRVTVGVDEIQIEDQNSANGTRLNGKDIVSGQPVVLNPNDKVALGSSEFELSFYSIPKPFELFDKDSQKSSFATTMEEMSREVEARARAQLERETEKLRAQMALELQDRRLLLNSEIEKYRQSTEFELNTEKANARREADSLIAESQKRIREEIKNSTQAMESRLDFARKKSQQTIDEAEARAREILNQAREESRGIKAKSADEAQQIYLDTLTKSQVKAAEVTETSLIEISEKEKALLGQARLEISREREEFVKEQEKISKEYLKRKSGLEEQVKNLDEKLAKLGSEFETLKGNKKKTEEDFDAIKVTYLEAKKLVATVHDVELQKAQIEHELKELREKVTVESVTRKQGLEQQLAQERLAKLNSLQLEINEEEKKYEQTRRLRALELSQDLHDTLLPKIEEWAADVPAAKLKMKVEIEKAVNNLIVNKSSSIVSGNLAVSEVKMAVKQQKRQRVFQQVSFAMVVLVGLAIVVYRRELYHILAESQKDSFAGKLMELRRIQSVYSPEQTDDFRESYSDNVLYKRGYFEVKSSSDYIGKWTLHLNNLAFLRSMNLSEEAIVQFISKEANLVKRLGVLRSSIDAMYLSEGLERMRNTEREDLKEIIGILKSEENFKKIRSEEKEFLSRFSKTLK